MEVLNSLENEQVKNAVKKLYKNMSAAYDAKIEAEIGKKERELSLKEDVASVLNIRNKQGEIQPSKVKMPLLAAGIEEVYEDKPNKKEVEYETMVEYRNKLVTKDISEAAVRGYLSSLEALNGVKDEIKAINSSQEAFILDGEVFNAIEDLVLKEYKENLDIRLAEAGFKTSGSKEKETKNPTDYKALVDKVKDILNN